MPTTTTQNYLDLLEATNVADIDSTTLVAFINEARTEILGQANWPFRQQSETLTTPTTTPISGGTILYVKNSMGFPIEAVDQQEAQTGAALSLGTGVAASYYLTNDGEDTFVNPLPSDTVTVVYYLPTDLLNETTNTVETIIPDQHKMAVVYAAALRAHTFVGVLDMAETYSNLAARALASMREAELRQQTEAAGVVYDAGP